MSEEIQESIYSKVVKFRQENPEATLQKIASSVGITKQRAWRILTEAGFRIEGVNKYYRCKECGKYLGIKKKSYCPECKRKLKLIPVSCDTCGKIFYRSAKSQERLITKRNYKHTFCSRQCLGKWLAQHRSHKGKSKFEIENKIEFNNLLSDVENLLGLVVNELGFMEISNHIPAADWQVLKEKWASPGK